MTVQAVRLAPYKYSYLLTYLLTIGEKSVAASATRRSFDDAWVYVVRHLLGLIAAYRDRNDNAQ